MQFLVPTDFIYFLLILFLILIVIRARSRKDEASYNVLERYDLICNVARWNVMITVIKLNLGLELFDLLSQQKF